MVQDALPAGHENKPIDTVITGYKRRYFPDLDSWRFFLFIIVYGHHAFDDMVVKALPPPRRQMIHLLFENAHAAVYFFFVISGFIITYQLLEEKYFMGRLQIGRFYMRRVLRICPPYFLIVFIGFVMWPILYRHGIGDPPNTATDYRLYLGFMANYDTLLHGLSNCGVLNILWSASVEEQFYLIWPILLLLLSPKRLWKVILGIVLISLIYRFMLLPDESAMRKDTLASLSDLSIGGLAAYVSIRYKQFTDWLADIRRGWIVALYVLTAAVYFLQEGLFPGAAFALSRLVFGLLFAAIILEQNYCRHSFFKMRRIGIFRKMGKYTYGLYGLHMIGVFAAVVICRQFYTGNRLLQFLFIQLPIGFMLAIGLGLLCYQFVERPFLRIKSAFYPKQSRQKPEPQQSLAAAPPETGIRT